MNKIITILILWICFSCDNRKVDDLHVDIQKEKLYNLYSIKDSKNNTIKAWAEIFNGDSIIDVVWKGKKDIPTRCLGMPGLSECLLDHDLCHIINDLDFGTQVDCKKKFNKCVNDAGCPEMKIPKIVIEKGSLIIVRYSEETK